MGMHIKLKNVKDLTFYSLIIILSVLTIKNHTLTVILIPKSTVLACAKIRLLNLRYYVTIFQI